MENAAKAKTISKPYPFMVSKDPGIMQIGINRRKTDMICFRSDYTDGEES